MTAAAAAAITFDFLFFTAKMSLFYFGNIFVKFHPNFTTL